MPSDRFYRSMAKKLKVFRTAIGFHDAYIAAPSQKAALKAWGAKRNLFASGAAEPVSDPELVRAALAKPGMVLKVSRGSPAEQLAALGNAKPAPVRAGAKEHAKPVPVERPATPRPSRAELDDAEAALSELEACQQAAVGELARQETELKRKRAALEKLQERDLARAVKQRDREQAAYDRAFARWKSGAT